MLIINYLSDSNWIFRITQEGENPKNHNFNQDPKEEITKRTWQTNFKRSIQEDFSTSEVLNQKYNSNKENQEKFNQNLVSPEISFKEVVKDQIEHDPKTRNNKIQQHSKTENDLIKVENLQWISDPKNNSNEFQNYLTEFREVPTFSSGISSPNLKSPSEAHFDKNKEESSKINSKNWNDSELLNKILNDQDNSYQIFRSWKQQNNSLQSILHLLLQYR